MKPAKKAYRVNTRNLYSGHESIAMGYLNSFYADNEKEARKAALRELSDHGIENDSNDEPLTYISVKVYRCPDTDQFLIDGRLRTRWQIEEDKKRVDRDNEFKQMLANNPGAYAYIKKGGYYYKPNHCGYTEFQVYAGVYTLEEAVRTCCGMSLSDYMRPILINVEEHNASVNKQIEELKTRLIILNQEA